MDKEFRYTRDNVRRQRRLPRPESSGLAQPVTPGLKGLSGCTGLPVVACAVNPIGASHGVLPCLCEQGAGSYLAYPIRARGISFQRVV